MTRKPATPAAAERLHFGRGNPGRTSRMATTDSANPADRAYPFAGIVGMADLKLALLLNAVSPAIGGVLVRGEKGTAKSTMVRGLAPLLPPGPGGRGRPDSFHPPAPHPRGPAGAPRDAFPRTPPGT